MKKLINKNLVLKGIIVVISLILLISKVSAVGIQISFQASVSETTVSVFVTIDSTLPYEVYENNSMIANGTLIANVMSNITTPRNMTVNATIFYSFFISDITVEYYHYIWINFTYSNVGVDEIGTPGNEITWTTDPFPDISTSEVKVILLLTILALFIIAIKISRTKTKR